MRAILISLFILLTIGTGIWYFFFKTPTQTGSTPAVTIGTFFPKAEQITLTDPSAILNNTTGTGEQVVSNGQNSNNGAFTQITQNPIAGYIAFDRTVTIPSAVAGEKPVTTTEHVIRYVSRTNGYVYEISNNTRLRITNISIPNVYEALFTPDGKTVIERFLRDDTQTIATYIIPIPDQNSDGTRTQREGVYLPDNISSISMSPDGTKAIAVLPGSLNTTITSFTIPTNTATNYTTTSKELYRSPFSEWLVSTPNQNSIFLQTKASNSSEGFVYGLDTANTKLRRIIGNIMGLTTSISPNSAYVLYSEASSVSNIINTKLYTIATGNTIAIGHNILPEKCTWLASQNLLCAGNDTITEGAYPDSWYAGVSRFSDAFYQINSTNGNYQVINNGLDISVDAINLQTSEKEGFLYFIDKSTGNLWRLRY